MLSEDVLHGANFEFEAIYEHIGLVGSYHCIRGVLGVGRGVNIVAPCHDLEGEFSYSCMHGGSVNDVPNYEGVVLADTSQEPVIRAES